MKRIAMGTLIILSAFAIFIMVLMLYSPLVAARDFVACDRSHPNGEDFVPNRTTIELSSYPGVYGTSMLPSRFIDLTFSHENWGRQSDWLRAKFDPFGQHAYSTVKVATVGAQIKFYGPRYFASGVKSIACSLPNCYYTEGAQSDGTFAIEVGSTNPYAMDPGRLHRVSMQVYLDPQNTGHVDRYSVRWLRGEIARRPNGQYYRDCKDGSCANICTGINNFFPVISSAMTTNSQATTCMSATWPGGGTQSCTRIGMRPVLK